jgi:glycosyltransferase involved in cell wall biosynthesis
MKSLHVCNASNVAYGYCKILRAAGHEAELRCHDIPHVMSQPEWYDLELSPEDFPDENNFFRNTADLGGYRRPAWFQTPPVFLRDPRANRLKQGLKRMLPQRLLARLRPWYRRAARRLSECIAADGPAVRSEQLGRLIAVSRQYGREWWVTEDMLAEFVPQAAWLARQLAGHDVVVGYLFAPIYAMLLGSIPYICVEIGTLRDTPFDGTPAGKLLALAYRLADHVIVTNPDVVRQARQLGLERYSFCPHPVDEDLFRPADGPAGTSPAARPERPSTLRQELCARYDADFILFAPARQNWAIKGNDKMFRGFARLVRQGTRAVLVVPAWGQEIERSRQLVGDLQLGQRVAWIPPCSEPLLRKYYQASDLVLDQFQLGVFGLITGKAMACGKPVLTSYNEDHHGWCFAEHPPLVRCRSETDIAGALRRLAKDRSRIPLLGQAARRWVTQHHSKKVITEKMEEAMKRAVRQLEVGPNHCGGVRIRP